MSYLDDIARSSLPIVIYGTGNGADWVLDEFERRGIRVSGCFASDGFVRSRTFRGYKVLSYQEAKDIFGEMIVILCFGTHDSTWIDKIKKIGEENELYMPDFIKDDEGNIFDIEYCKKHRADIEFAYNALADDISRKSFKSIIDFRLTGRIEYLLEDQFEDVESWKLLNISRDEVFVDCGAYNGDTISRFCSLSKSWSSIYGLEPDKKSFKKLVKNSTGMENVHLLNAFVSDRLGSVCFSMGKGRGSVCDSSGETIDSVTVDHVLNGGRATILKYDTEGFEKEALDGSYETIMRYKPRMIVSAYHKPHDLWSLVKQIYLMRDDYRFYLRKSPALPYWDSNYYVL